MHAKHKTKLLETYSYWKSEGKLSEKLDALLRANGVQYKSVNEAEIVRCIMRNENDYGLAEIVKLIESFLRLYKENTAISFAQLRETVKGYADPYERKRAELFLSIAEPIYNLYESRLRDKELIDFSDMIIEAADIIRNGYVLHDLDYIIVDEFQDISQSRYSLITALRDRTNAKIFCAGDDWQSIYRFTGCELDFLTRFEKHFGYSKLLRVEHTYRYSQELISAIEPFILKNPAQIRKSMRSSNHEANPVRLYRYTQSKEGVLSSAVEDIVKTYGQKKSILLLMRNNFDLNFLNESENWYVQTDKQERIRTCIYRIYPDLRITAMTVHSSKGVEADNVIIVNGDNALVGFPNKMADDPLIQLLRIGDEKYTYAEERRLFYVAVTRTKYRTYILTPESAPSEFILELSEMPNVSVYKETEKTGEQLYVCPHCLRGHLVHRKSLENGQEFVGCSLYPQCRNTYNDTSLLKHAIKCPRCQGYMVKRNGVNGIFIGCSNYPLCKNTMSAYSEYPQAKVGIKATR